MKTYAHRLYHFLGGIHVALFLIAAAAVFVIAGTFIESTTQSHRFAANFTYSNPLFALLLWGFFVNILFSATRRWPFKVRHIPFLVTHLGLLMMLSGVLGKHYFGVQGTMSLMEGGASQEIFELGSYAVQVEKHAVPPARYALQSTLGGGFDSVIASNADGLDLRLAAFHPHSTERYASWVKGDYAVISGLNPIAIYEMDFADMDATIPLGAKARFYPSAPAWRLYAIRTALPAKAIAQLYRQNAQLRVVERLTAKVIADMPLVQAMQSPVELGEYGAATFGLQLPFSTITGLDDPQLQVQLRAGHSEKPLQMKIPLDGAHALLNINLTTPYLGSLPIAVDIDSPPLLAIIEDENYDVHLAAVDAHGRLSWQAFRSDNLEALLAYDEGFGGYAVQAALPFKQKASSRAWREAAIMHRLAEQLRLAVMQGIELSPPLQLWQQACQKADVDYIETFMSLLRHWDATYSWIYPKDVPLPPNLAPLMAQLDLRSIPARQRQACQWTMDFFEQLETPLQQGQDVLEILRAKQWPLLSTLEAELPHQGPLSSAESSAILAQLIQQIFSAADLLPLMQSIEAKKPPTAELQAALFSAYLRAYAIHISSVVPLPASIEELEQLLQVYATAKNEPAATDPTAVVLETTVIPAQQSVPPSSKLEDHFPLIKLVARKGELTQATHLSYDHYGTGLKWPILNGEYLVRFQPAYSAIPYRIRLRHARQINYPNSSQPYSFESDLIITDTRSGQQIEKTISMNHVHETWDGYRFYLASLTPPTEGAVKRVQIVVNHDPAKYWLTYPGAFLVSCGILLLFAMRPYRQRK